MSGSRLPDDLRGRGARSQLEGRFEQATREAFDDGWALDEDPAPSLATIVTDETARSIISHNQSPDLAFRNTLNPYRGCEHGCIYCYARPTHAYLNLSPGLDFETRIIAKRNAAEILEKTLAAPSYQPEQLVIGANTDPYQPVERSLGLTRAVLEVLWHTRHPTWIITKGATLMERDLDLFEKMAGEGLIGIAISLTSLDNETKRRLEPRTSSPAARLRLMRKLAEVGVPVTVLTSPLIPAINDHEVEAMIAAAAEAGASAAGYAMLRLPHEVAPLFEQWLEAHYPERAAHVLSLVRGMREGALNSAQFGERMRGLGPHAEMVRQRFLLACRRHGLDHRHGPRSALDTSKFRRPGAAGRAQGELF